MASEDGVWRTISGRRVFIKKGQSLTDAMKESGKFGDDRKPKRSEKKSAEPAKTATRLKDGETQRIYGKDEGGTYQASSTNEYTLTGDRAGKKIEIPENDTDGVVVFKAPNTSGFVDGKYVSDENVNTIFSDGRIVLNDYSYNNYMNTKLHGIVEAETLRLAGLKREGLFYRGTDNDAEIEYLKSGTMRASKNHDTGEAEDGVSVWESPKYSFKHMYAVTGDVVSIGSDGEPVLDPKSIKLVSTKSFSIKDYNKAMEIGKQAFMELYGWTEQQYDDALNHRVSSKKRL